MSILVVRLDGIGDLVLTTPLFRELRRLMPHAHIAALVSPKTSSLLESSSDIDQIITYDVPKGLRLSPTKHLKYLIDFAQSNLADRNWDVALNPRWDEDVKDESFLCLVSGAKIRIGYPENTTPEKAFSCAGYNKVYTKLASKNGAPMHARDRTLYVLRQFLPEAVAVPPSIAISPMDRDFALDLLRQYSSLSSNSGITIALGLGAADDRRIWPIENFIELGKRIVDTYNAKLIMIGGKADVKSAGLVALSLPNNVIDATGRCDLTQTAAVLSLTDLFVGNDSGPLHIAAATSPAVISLSCHSLEGAKEHANSPLCFGPIGESVAVIQPKRPKPPCSDSCFPPFAHCITNITVDEVFEQVALKVVSLV